MNLKQYQSRAMEEVRAYLEHLRERRDKLRDGDGYLADFAESAWEKAGVPRSYVKRKDGLGRPLPVFCLKVPTGGGKTLLAVKTIDLTQAIYLRRSNGLVVWVTPTLQIYRQTLQALRDRDHPYRQHLDQVSAGRTIVMEKSDRLTPADVEENLVILLLMLPSASRANKEALRMFRDSGGYAEFFPPEEDWRAHAALLKANPKLDAFSDEGLPGMRLVKTSLGNVIRRQEAVFIVDEGHRAYSEQALSTLRDLNPCLIVELSATPPKEANKLVVIGGRELLREEMIKLDLHIVNKESTNWRDTLRASMERRDRLEEAAREHEANTNQHIRPIALIQVERTGKDQDDGKHIHANNVRDYLLQQGVAAEQIAAKTADTDDLKDFDDVGGLLARDCPVRYIITKSALQEGWDCPFAYVLTVLTHPQSKTAITQLIGRILRQPHARKTGIRVLDESYVFCFQRTRLLDEVRAGFMQEGLEDVNGRIVSEAAEDAPGALVKSSVRTKFRKEAGNLILPAFFIRDGENWRLVSHEMDILSRLDWKQVDVTPLYDLPLDLGQKRDIELTTGLDERLEELRRWEAPEAGGDIDLSYAAAHLLDTVPNPWVGHALIERVFTEIRKRHPGGEKAVNANLVHILERTRAHLEKERDRLSEVVFNRLLEQDQMRFMVLADERAIRLPKAGLIRESASRMTRANNAPLELNLLDPLDADDFNALESEVASFLDEQSRLYFWYRNRPGTGGYFVQGWKPERIFADFIFTSKGAESKQVRHVFVVETKGLHLRGNADTRYKESVFHLCNGQARKQSMTEFAPSMQGKHVRLEVVHQEEWREQLLRLLEQANAPESAASGSR